MTEPIFEKMVLILADMFCIAIAGRCLKLGFKPITLGESVSGIANFQQTKVPRG